MSRERFQNLLSVTIVMVCGCGSELDHWTALRPATMPASGVVTFHGEPLAGAVVVFQPTEPDGIGASALTDDQGKFELRTFPPESGAVPGSYSVSIMKTETPEQSASEEQVDDPLPVHAISLIPERYSIPTTSGLTAEVPDMGTDALVFELQE